MWHLSLCNNTEEEGPGSVTVTIFVVGDGHRVFNYAFIFNSLHNDFDVWLFSGVLLHFMS